MSKREIIKRERRAFEHGVFTALGALTVAFSVFSYFMDNITLASACALFVISLCCFNEELIRKDVSHM